MRRMEDGGMVKKDGGETNRWSCLLKDLLHC